jgi:pimeloyl-ACP methyl ester carboxylesterase
MPAEEESVEYSVQISSLLRSNHTQLAIEIHGSPMRTNFCAISIPGMGIPTESSIATRSIAGFAAVTYENTEKIDDIVHVFSLSEQAERLLDILRYAETMSDDIALNAHSMGALVVAKAYAIDPRAFRNVHTITLTNPVYYPLKEPMIAFYERIGKPLVQVENGVIVNCKTRLFLPNELIDELTLDPIPLLEKLLENRRCLVLISQGDPMDLGTTAQKELLYKLPNITVIQLDTSDHLIEPQSAAERQIAQLFADFVDKSPFNKEHTWLHKKATALLGANN